MVTIALMAAAFFVGVAFSDEVIDQLIKLKGKFGF